MQWTRVGLVLAGTALLLSGGFTRPPQGEPFAATTTLGRDLVRPWLLPFLWRGLDRAVVQGTPEEYAARGRLLMRMLPDWTDGHVHVAWTLAFDASLAQADPEPALDRLLAGIDLLEENLSPPKRKQEELLTAMASILEIRCHQDERLAKAFRMRLGKDPFAVADSYLQRAQQLRASDVRTTHRVFLRLRVMAGQIRLRNVGAAKSILHQNLRDLDRMQGDRTQVSDSTQRLESALQLLKSHWDGNADVGLEVLAANTYLDEIVSALRDVSDNPRPAYKEHRKR